MGRSKLLLILMLAPLLIECGNEKKQGDGKEKVHTATDSLLKKDGKKQELVRYPNGNKKLTGTYRNGKRHGVWSSWYKDGSLKSELRYEKGQRHGFYKTWYKNGQLRYEGQYRHGKRSGTWKYYNKEGELIKTQDFEKEKAGSKDPEADR